MDPGSQARNRALSHRQYLDNLVQPSPSEIRRISDLQVQKEREIDSKYHTAEEHAAATTIQKAYRGHRERRQLSGLSLDPSSRWVEIIKEMRYRSAIAPHYMSKSPARNARDRSASDLAKLNWRRAGQIAEHAGAGESTASLDTTDIVASSRRKSRSDTNTSMLMDLHYFLEMVDQKHRYGANLQIFHEEWLREETDQNFFYWLDHGSGHQLDLPGCSWAKLDKERIRYLSKEERTDYLVRVDGEGKLRWDKTGELITTSVERYQDSMRGIVPRGSLEPTFNDDVVKRQLSADASFASKVAAAGKQYLDVLRDEPPMDQYLSNPVQDSDFDSSSSMEKEIASHPAAPPSKPAKRHILASPATILNHLLRATVRPGTWIYVADTVGRLYVGIKSSGAFQHASFLSGARISSAGAISIEDGQLTYLSPLSGHYRPTTKSFRNFVKALKRQDVDLSKLKVSKAYAVLLGMEYYGRTRKGMRKVIHAEDEKTRSTKH